MKLLKKIFLIANAATLLITASCNETVTPLPQPQFKHPREMTWTADTLKPFEGAIQLLPWNILAFAPNDVWLVAYSDIAKGLLWHFDGKEWKSIETGGGKRYDDLAGYNSNDIWLGGYSGKGLGDKWERYVFLEHYNGRTFTRYDTGLKGEIIDMTKDPQGNIWACGRNGIIMKYDKTKWIVDTLKMKFTTDTEYFLKGIEYYNNKVFLLITTGNLTTHIETLYYAHGDVGKWIVADSMKFDSPTSIRKWGYRELYSSSWGKLYSNGLGGVWEYGENKWENILPVSGAINGVFGADNNNIYAVGDFQKTFFYDGTKWEDIKDLFKLTDPYFSFKTGWTNGYETFVIGYTFQSWPQQTIIWHGK